MKDILINMDSSGAFSFSGDVGRIEEYCAKRLKIKLNSDFLSQSITYYTLSFEPYSLSRKIITENIYVQSDSTDGIYFMNGYIYCPVYDYIAIAPEVMVQIDAYETDSAGNVTAIIKSGIFTLEFDKSLTGEAVMLETTRPDVKFSEKVNEAVAKAMETQVLDGAKLKKFSVSANKLQVLSISAPQLADFAVTASKIAYGVVGTEHLAEGSVTGPKIKYGSVTGDKLADNSVDDEKLADKSVTSSKLADNAVLSTKLATYCVTEDKIRPRAISTTKLKEKCVTPAILDRSYLTHHQSLVGYATEDWVKMQEYVKGDDLESKADKTDLPEKLSQLQNDIAVSFVKQKLNAEQKTTARDNIGAVKAVEGKVLSSNDFTDEEKEKLSKAITEHQDISMKADKSELPKKLSELENDVALTFTEQVLTDEQKLTVLDNIGAVKASEGKVLSSNDFTDEEKEKLSKAITEHQDISMKADKSEMADVAFSGSYNDLKDLPECSFNYELKENYDAAYAHSLEEHADIKAQENIIEEIIINGSQIPVKEKKVSFSVIDFTFAEPIFAEV